MSVAPKRQRHPRKREHFSQVAGDRVEPKALALGDALRAGLQELKEPE